MEKIIIRMKNGRGGIRTPGPLVPNQDLYFKSISYKNHTRLDHPPIITEGTNKLNKSFLPLILVYF